MNNILYATISLGGMGLLLGLALAVCGKIFEVKVDERVPLIMEALPSANCGGCGYAGCSAYANAVVEGKAALTLCSAGGQECVDQISKIMGVAAEKAVRMTARVRCVGTDKQAINKYFYDGEHDCVSASRLGGGPKACASGCLGYGTCVSACKFDAIVMESGVAVIDESKCTGCGACVKSCPKKVIAMLPHASKVYVGCANTEKGGVVKNQCAIGCIGCRLCAKSCEAEAITIANNLATVDPEKCTNCRKCLEVCPKRVVRLRKLTK